MPGQLTHVCRIERYAQGLCVGDVVTASQVVKALGGRHINARQIGRVFSSLPDIMEFTSRKNGAGTWRRV